MITHERANMDEFNDYFALKFAPLSVVYVMGRSYAAQPECDPKVTLYDAWMDLLACSTCILAVAVPVRWVRSFWGVWEGLTRQMDRAVVHGGRCRSMCRGFPTVHSESESWFFSDEVLGCRCHSGSR